MNSSHASYAMYSAGSPASWNGPVTLQQETSIAVNGGYTLDISGPIGGAGGLVKMDDGTLILSGSTANTYSGDTRVKLGTLALDKSVYNVTIPGNLYIGDGVGGADADVVRLLTTSQIPSSSRITISDSGYFDMNSLTEYFGSLEGSGHVDMGSANLGAGEDDTSTSFAGLIEGSGELRKYGSGTFTLSGNNSYTGTTRVYEGTVVVNGSQSGSDVVVSSPGTLGGVGTVGAISSSGSVSPGTSAGQLGCGSATLQSGSSFNVELDGNSSINYDQLDVGGSVSLGNSDLNVSWGFVPTVGNAFTIIDNDGTDAVTSIFNGLPEGTSLVVGNVTSKITYAGGTGNDVVLEVTAVQPVEDLHITSIETAGGDVHLQWTGGAPTYVVEMKTALSDATWTPVTTPMSGTQTNLPMSTPEAWYRVAGGN
jgi:autotransporter-associated beta strand protein